MNSTQITQAQATATIAGIPDQAGHGIIRFGDMCVRMTPIALDLDTANLPFLQLEARLINGAWVAQQVSVLCAAPRLIAAASIASVDGKQGAAKEAVPRTPAVTPIATPVAAPVAATPSAPVPPAASEATSAVPDEHATSAQKAPTTQIAQQPLTPRSPAAQAAPSTPRGVTGMTGTPQRTAAPAPRSMPQAASQAPSHTASQASSHPAPPRGTSTPAPTPHSAPKMPAATGAPSQTSAPARPSPNQAAIKPVGPGRAAPGAPVALPQAQAARPAAPAMAFNPNSLNDDIDY